jgi:hypothetical protein
MEINIAKPRLRRRKKGLTLPRSVPRAFENQQVAEEKNSTENSMQGVWGSAVVVSEMAGAPVEDESWLMD